MSTCSRIGIEHMDGTITSVYCHFDGYIDGGVGESLLTDHATRTHAEALVALGNLSSVAGGDVEAYARDRGENFADNKPLVSANRAQYLRHADQSGAECAYLFPYQSPNGVLTMFELLPGLLEEHRVGWLVHVVRPGRKWEDLATVFAQDNKNKGDEDEE